MAGVARRAGCVALALFALGSTTASAQPAPSEPATPEPGASELDLFKLEGALTAPVVTASGGAEEERALSSANVYSIDREEILVHGWRSLAEILANVPGLYIVDDHVLPSLGVRGVTGGLQAGTRIVKVMIDGQVVNFRPQLTASLGPEFIPVDAIERVEVAKGPLSALYGANAFLATVNVITRKPTQLVAEGEGRLGVIQSSVSGGGSGLIGYAGANRGIMVAFSADRIDRSGLGLQNTFPTQDTSAGIFHRTSKGDLSLPVSAIVRAWFGSERLGTLTLSGGVQKLDANGEFQLNSVLTDQTRIALTNWWSNLNWEKQWQKWSLAATLGYSQGVRERDYKLFLTDNSAYTFTPNFNYWAVDANVAGGWSPLGDRLSLRVGLDTDFASERVLYYTQTYNVQEGQRQPGDKIDLIGPNDPRRQSYYDIGVFVQATSVPLRRLPGLHLTGDFRIDKIKFGPVDFPVQYSWRGAIAYRWNAAVVTKLIAGRAFQTPSGVLLFGHAGFGNANNVVGSQNIPGLAPLRPQVVNSVELVAAATLFRHLSLEGAVFFQALDDKIEFIQTGTDFVAANRGERLSIGLEATARFRYHWLSAYGSVSVQDGFTDGKLDARPPALYPIVWGVVGAQADVPRAWLRVLVQLRAVGPRGASQSNIYLNNGQPYELPAYADLDLTVSSMALHLFGPEADTFLLASVRNIIGEQHSEPGFAGIDVPSLGRTFFFQLRQTF